MSRITLFADILLPLGVQNLFTYRVPFELNDALLIGTRVVVPFGKSKFQTGIVINIHENIPNGYEAKYIEHLLDESPVINQKQFKLWQWVSQYYLAPLGDVMNAALPGNLKLASETKIQLHPNFNGNTANLSDRGFQVVEALEIAQSNNEDLSLKQLAEIFNLKNVMPLIKVLIDQQVVITVEELQEKHSIKHLKYVCISDDYLSEEKLSEALESLNQKKKDLHLYEVLLQAIGAGLWIDGNTQWVLRKDLEKLGLSTSSIETLAKRGILTIESRPVNRIALFSKDIKPISPLSPAQAVAHTEIVEAFETLDTCLLEGITGSGKTEIYVHLINEVLSQGKQVFFMLPEISLTSQLIQRLRSFFGDQVGVYHSKYNQNERLEVWNELLKEEFSRFKIIVGTRSSVFLPFSNLGLIIIDEEHETSFKQQDPSPRYNGRSTALVLAQQHKAKTLLGSATPSFESKFLAKEGKFGYVQLSERFGNSILPLIELIDMKKEREVNQNFSFFSKKMLFEIGLAIENKKQVILFQNRRGYTPQQNCEVCGWVAECKNCDVKLTYHMQGNVLKCHYCGYVQSPISTCNSCGSTRIKTQGFGTEKIEDELQLHFPKLRIARMDLDSTRTKNAFTNLIEQFEEQQIDVMIGTQMITKGLDFENVHLVGIVDADQMLNAPDFRAHERAFQLMTQVAGRAGRRETQGKVFIQTGQVENWVVNAIKQQNFEQFYALELEERERYFYPPYTKLIEITLKHREENILIENSMAFGEALFTHFGNRLNGPDRPAIGRIKNMHLRVIKIKIERAISQIKTKEIIQECLNTFYQNARHRSTIVSINVDPV